MEDLVGARHAQAELLVQNRCLGEEMFAVVRGEGVDVCVQRGGHNRRILWMTAATRRINGLGGVVSSAMSAARNSSKAGRAAGALAVRLRAVSW